MTQSRTRAYPKGADNDRAREAYEPIPNEQLVRTLGAVGTVAEEYLRIGNHVESSTTLDTAAHTRVLHIATDTVIEMNGIGAELRGDALFVFNAFAAARSTLQKSQDLQSYGSGFRSHNLTAASTGNVATYFMRAVQALDAWSRDASDLDLIYRTGYGSGSNPKFMLQPDLNIIDARAR